MNPMEIAMAEIESRKGYNYLYPTLCNDEKEETEYIAWLSNTLSDEDGFYTTLKAQAGYGLYEFWANATNKETANYYYRMAVWKFYMHDKWDEWGRNEDAKRKIEDEFDALWVKLEPLIINSMMAVTPIKTAEIMLGHRTMLYK